MAIMSTYTWFMSVSHYTYGEMPSGKRDHQLVQIYIHIYALSTYIASSPGLKACHIPRTQTSQLVAQQCSSLDSCARTSCIWAIESSPCVRVWLCNGLVFSLTCKTPIYRKTKNEPYCSRGNHSKVTNV